MKSPATLAERLAETRRFDQLIALLRDELDWPIGSADFEDLTFEYDAEELGIDRKSAAKIEEIKRLRPLVPNQPWGIFFLKFEPKRLPVVALRRILGAVAIKKRASANSAERAAWAPDDLLFVSNYGEGEERQISFAHFARSADGGDLPTLKVLGWDNRDTALHLEAVARQLREHLVWPKTNDDVDAWRRLWRGAFTLSHREVITTSKELSIRLAHLARAIRQRLESALAIETERGPLTRLMRGFEEALVHDLGPDGFADMYAQTVAYGLLSARIADPQRKTADDFPAHMRANPFLRELLEAFLGVSGRHGAAGANGIDFDELGIAEVVALLDAANMEAVVRDFGDRNPQEDPVIHFYELFLKEYDPSKRMQRGVFYTPLPVVSYIVRSVDEVLRTKFGLADGLADTTTWGELAQRNEALVIPDGVSPEQPFVQVLDPATGTGTFLVEAIDLIYKTMLGKWQLQGHDPTAIQVLWNAYVPTHLLPRLYGYELLMAPYSIAHLKIGRKLFETGYHFGSDERVHVYLTNALEPAQPESGQLELSVPALAHEARAVSEVKRKRKFTVVLGNPPYSAVSSNRSPWIENLMAEYKTNVIRQETQIRNLSDDYVKFIRLGQYHINSTESGVVAMITNSGFLDGLIFRDVRRALLESFNAFWVLDIGGHGRRSKDAGQRDESVFDILVGTSITVLANVPGGRSQVDRCNVRGSRDVKHEFLAKSSVMTTRWTRVSPAPEHYLFQNFDAARVEEYGEFVPFLALWGTGKEDADRHKIYGSGFKTQQDEFAIALNREEIVDRMELLLEPSTTETSLRKLFRMCRTNQWSFGNARDRLSKTDWRSKVVQVAYRPFDLRWTCYSPDVVTNPRPLVMAQLMKANRAMVVTRQLSGSDWRHVLVTSHPTDMCAISPQSKEACHVFPLFKAIAADSLFSETQTEDRDHNLSSKALDYLESVARHGETASRGQEAGFAVRPEAFFDYVYAVLHSPQYRQRYAEQLVSDFPRVPLAGNRELFGDLVLLGTELVDLHLLASHSILEIDTEYVPGDSREIETVVWSASTVWLDRAQTSGFRGVPREIWEFRIGGYQVCEKWLKDRKGRVLSEDDVTHYQEIVAALAETIRLMNAIDEVIDLHGGWPGAFLPAT